MLNFSIFKLSYKLVIQASCFITSSKFQPVYGVHISIKYNSMRFHPGRAPFIHVCVPSAKQLYYLKYFKMFSITT